PLQVIAWLSPYPAPAAPQPPSNDLALCILLPSWPCLTVSQDAPLQAIASLSPSPAPPAPQPPSNDLASCILLPSWPCLTVSQDAPLQAIAWLSPSQALPTPQLPSNDLHHNTQVPDLQQHPELELCNPEALHQYEAEAFF